MRLTSDEALELSKQLTLESKARVEKRAEAKPYPSRPTVGMKDTHYLHYTWDYHFERVAIARWHQWNFETPKQFKQRFILNLRIRPCTACMIKKEDESFKTIYPCNTCDGSGCPSCQRWGLFDCKMCFDFGEVWILPDGREIKVTELPRHIPLPEVPLTSIR